jgi:hypothetical protein
MSKDSTSLRASLRTLLPIVPKIEKIRFYFLLCLSVIMALCELLLAGAVALLAAAFGSFDAVLNNNSVRLMRQYIGGAFWEDPRFLSLALLCLVLAIILCKNLLTLLQQWHLSRFSETIGEV